MDAREKEQVLSDLIQIHSVNGNELAVANYLHSLFARHGLAATVAPFGNQRANLILEAGHGDRVLGLTSHMDTVAVGDPAAWHHPPFAATRIGDRIYGRGAADAKGGLAAMALALIELHEAGALPGRVRLLATAGEEYGTPGANRLVEAGYARDLAGLVVGEATGGKVVYAHAGSINYQVTSHGKAAHSSRPQDGVNALTPLVDFFTREATLFADAAHDPALGAVQHSVTVLTGGDQVNSLPATAKLAGNVRPTPSFSNQAVIGRLQDLVDQVAAAHPGARLELEVIHDFYPVTAAPEGPLAQLALKAARTAFGTEPQLTTINGATDASVFVKAQPDLPVVVLGPAAWENSHQVDEWTTGSSYLATIEAYKQLVTGFFA